MATNREEDITYDKGEIMTTNSEAETTETNGEEAITATYGKGEIMAICGHEGCYITLPPTLESLRENYSHITPNESLDRSILRCRLCDLIATNVREQTAAYPPPTFTNPIPGIQRHIASTEQLISDDIRKEELEASLPLMKKALEDEIRATNQRILEAWMGHWAIWGLGEGPDPENEYVEDEFVEDEKPNAPLKIKGRASIKKGGQAFSRKEERAQQR